MLMMTTIVLLVLSFFEAEGCGPELCAEVRQVLTTLPSVNEMLSKGRAKYMRVEPLTTSHRCAIAILLVSGDVGSLDASCSQKVLSEDGEY